MNNDKIDALLATAAKADSSDEQVKAAAQAVFDESQRWSQEEATAAVRRLSAGFAADNPAHGAFVALACGAFVERGCDPLAIAGPLTQQLMVLLEQADACAAACQARLPPQPEEDEDSGELFEKARREVNAENPALAAAWSALEMLWRPAIAVYSRSPEARAPARHLRGLAERIASHHEGGHWLQHMLGVLHAEPILVIAPQERSGILATISGIVDNFQLNVLLMDAFPRPSFFSPRRVSRRVADVARGKGPQQTGDIVTSVWNLYTWEAIAPGPALPDPSDYGTSAHGGTSAHAHWIWNEGAPRDIPVFEGRRVILLGPPSYPRSWQAQRLFEALPAALDVEHTLTKSECADWLQRMLAAKGTAQA